MVILVRFLILRYLISLPGKQTTFPSELGLHMKGSQFGRTKARHTEWIQWHCCSRRRLDCDDYFSITKISKQYRPLEVKYVYVVVNTKQKVTRSRWKVTEKRQESLCVVLEPPWLGGEGSGVGGEGTQGKRGPSGGLTLTHFAPHAESNNAKRTQLKFRLGDICPSPWGPQLSY